MMKLHIPWTARSRVFWWRASASVLDLPVSQRYGATKAARGKKYTSVWPQAPRADRPVQRETETRRWSLDRWVVPSLGATAGG